MPQIIALLGLLGAALLVLIGLMPPRWAGAAPRRTARLAEAAAWTGFAAAVLAAAMLAATSPVEQRVIGVGPLSLSVYYDALTAVMLLLVSFLGAAVLRYSRNYLDGDPRHGRFMQWMALTVASVLLLIVSGNLLMFAAAWMATSLSLHQLLTFYPERPAALLAARKKFVISRVGDLCLISAVALTYATFQSVEFGPVFRAAEALRAAGGSGEWLPWIAGLLVAGALLKSAQFPFHGWLTEVMETPTPVSALLHAGIINAGGFLIVRMSPLVSLSTPALEVLAVVGAITALFGSVVMLTQTSIKVSLAWSTVGQMGFMMLQCGLGAFSAAVLHLVAHSLYKAHAFLSSGSVIDVSKASWVPKASGAPHPLRFAAALAVAVLFTFGVGWAFGIDPSHKPGAVVLGAVLMMGLTHLVWNALDEHAGPAVMLRGVGIVLGVAMVYFALQIGAEALLAGAVAQVPTPRGVFGVALIGAVITAFLVVLVLQTQLPYRKGSAPWRAAYVHLFNGFYLNAFANRVMQRVWPPVPPSALKGVDQ